MTVKQLHENVIEIRINARDTQFKTKFLFKSDCHQDSKQCNEKLLIKHLEIARKEDAMVFDFGDLFDAMQANDDRRAMKESLRDDLVANAYFNKLVESAVDFYKPYKDLLLLQCYGNHETSVIRHKEIDLIRMFVNDMKYNGAANLIRGAYEGYILLKFELSSTEVLTKTIWYSHGKQGSNPARSKGVLDCDILLGQRDADIYVFGHRHNSWRVTLAKENINLGNGAITHKNTKFLQIPTYKMRHIKGQGYEAEKQFPASVLGSYMLSFERSVKNIDVYIKELTE